MDAERSQEIMASVKSFFRIRRNIPMTSSRTPRLYVLRSSLLDANIDELALGVFSSSYPLPKKTAGLDESTRLSKIYTVTNAVGELPSNMKSLAFDTLFYLLPDFTAPDAEHFGKLIESVGLVFMAVANERHAFPSQPEIFTPVIRRHWRKMLPWFTHFSHKSPLHAFYQKCLNTKQGIQALFAISAATFASIDAIRDDMCMDPELLRCVARLWRDEDTGKDKDEELAYASHALMLVLENDIKREIVVDALAEGYKEGVRGVAEIALSHMSGSFKSSCPNRVNMSWHLSIVLLLATTNLHPIQKALLQKQVVRLCSEAAVQVGQERDGTKFDSDVHECLGLYLQRTISLMSCSSSTQPVREALEHKHLDALLCCSSIIHRLPPNGKKLIEDQLHELLPTYLVFRSILEAAQNGLSNLQPPRFEAATKKTAVKGHWDAFLRLTFERSVYLLYHKASMRGQRGKTQVCDTVRFFSFSVK